MYRFSKLVYVLLLLWGMSSATFPPAWCVRIQAICRMAEQNPMSYPPVPLPTVHLDCATAPNDPMSHLIPPPPHFVVDPNGTIPFAVSEWNTLSCV